jgi:peptide/nickel transport system permease protein
MAVATPTPSPMNAVAASTRSRVGIILSMLWRDKFATVAVIFLLVVILCATFGPALLGEAAVKQNLRGRNAPPFSLQQGWLFFSAQMRWAGHYSPAS